MKKIILICTSLLLIILLNSCSHYYYMPNDQNVPLLRQKGEARVSWQSGSAQETSTNEFQAAYAITNKVAVMVNYMSANGGKKDTTSSWANGNYYEAAVGYFKPLGKKLVFEIYGGAGFANQHHQYDDFSFDIFSGIRGYSYAGYSDLSFTKFFIQPSLGVKVKAFEFALSTRLSNLNFNRIENHLYTSNSEFPYLDQITKNRNSFLLEPTFTIRCGWKHFKFQLQVQSSDNLTNQNLKFNYSNTSLGLWFAFSNKDLQSIFKKRK